VGNLEAGEWTSGGHPVQNPAFTSLINIVEMLPWITAHPEAVFATTKWTRYSASYPAIHFTPFHGATSAFVPE
jgi:hypothetical protein